MRYNIVVVGFLISVFNNVAVPEIVTQQPSPIQARLRTLVWLENGVTIKWCPCNGSARGYSAWKVFCHTAISQRCYVDAVIPMLRGVGADVNWVDGDFKPALPPNWYGRN